MSGLPSWPFNPVPDLFPGFSPITGPIANVVEVPAEGNVSIPGPANGRLRVICAIVLTATGAGPASVIASLQPTGLILGRALAPAVGGNSITLPALTFATSLVLGQGETISFVNSAAEPCALFFTYYDIPSVGRTLVRMQLSTTVAQNIIPAAPAGFVRRWLFPFGGMGTAPINAIALILFNDDTAAARVLQRRGPDLICRSSSAAAGGQVFSVAGDVVVTAAAALTAELAANVTTRPVSLLGCFEQVPAP